MVEVVGAWAVFNMLLTGLAMRAVAEKQQRRSVPRIPMQQPALIWTTLRRGPGGHGIDAVVEGAPPAVCAYWFGHPRLVNRAQRPRLCPRRARVSPFAYGFRSRDLECAHPRDVQSVTLSPEARSSVPRFRRDQTVAAREAVAYLMFNDSENWRRMRRDETRSRGLIRGSASAAPVAFSRSRARLPTWRGNRSRRKPDCQPSR